MSSSSAAPSLLVAGDLVLDRYRVLEQIAAGGHSLVFRGEDTRLARPVCVKVFSGLGGKSGVGRTTYEHFVQEAFALSRLTHPNTLRIYDFGHLDANKRLDTGRNEHRRERNEPVAEAGSAAGDELGLPLQVCEYMNGGTLSLLLREKGPQSVAETMRIARAMCEALAEAHDLGIVHRDIKPQNILFASVGDVRLPKLADFGIAKWSAEQDGDTAKRADDTQIVAGQKLAMYSPSWAAPEQLAGQQVGPGTDIYSLAALVIYMLTGKAIFSDEDVYAGYKKRRHWEPLVRDALLPLALPPAFVSMLVRALAFDPKERTSNIAVLSADLAKALATDPVADLREPGALPQAPAQWLGQSAVVQAAPPAPGSAPVPSPLGAPPGSGPVAPAPLGAGGQVHAPSPSSVEAPSGAEHEARFSDPSSRPGDPLDRLADGQRYRVYGGMPAGPAVTNAAAPAAPQSWGPPVPPVARQAWFSAQPSPSPQVRRVSPSELPILVGDRRLHFVFAPSGVADLIGPEGARLRLTILPADGRRLVHIKSLSCFVAHHGGRPSPAIHCDRDADVELVTPRAQPLAFARMTFGHAGSVETPFLLGSERITVAREDLVDPILFDFGPGSEAYLVYTQGRPAPRLAPRRGQ